MKRSVQFALAAAATAVAMTVGCSVSADGVQYTDATAVFWLVGHDHVPYRLQVELLTSVDNGIPSNAYVSEAHFGYLVVSGARCPGKVCGPSTTYQQQLVNNQYDNSDLKNISVHVGAYGGGLKVNWAGAGPSGPIDTDPAADTTGADLSSTWTATATLQWLGGVKCRDTVATAARHTHASPDAMSTPVGKPAPFKGGTGLPTGPITCTTAPRH